MPKRTTAAVQQQIEPTDAQVAAYLADHPDFLMRHGDLMSKLALPRRQWVGKGGSKVVDLQAAMLERLRSELEQVRQIEGVLLETSRSNLQTQMRIHAAVLSMLGSQGLEDLIDTVTRDLPVLLDVDAIALCVEASADALPIEGLRPLPRGTVEAIMGPTDRVLLRHDISGDKRIFGEAAAAVRSDALVRPEAVTEEEGPPFLLAFGSREPEHFHPDQGTELISFLGIVLWHTMGAWLEREV